MVTDEILCAVQGMIELFPTPEARNAGKAIWNMLADFEENTGMRQSIQGRSGNGCNNTLKIRRITL